METETEQLQEVEQEAKRMGWVEQENFKGDSDRWIDAEKFVERGKNELPIMRERLKKYDNDVKQLKTKIAGMTSTFKEFRSYAQEREQKAVEKAIKDISKKQETAVEEGDKDAFNELESEKMELLKTKQEVPEIQDDVMQEELQNWIDDGNEWFYNDQELGEYAAHISPYIAKKTTATGAAYFDEVKKEVMVRFPEKFGKNKQPVVNSVEGGTDQDPPKQGKKTYASLPTEAKEQCSKFIKEIPGFTKEEYLENYEW